MVEIGQSHGELLDVLTSKYTGGSQKMQANREKVSIHAEYDPATKTVQALVRGDNADLCVLLGALLRQVAEEWGRKTGDPAGAKADALEIVWNAAVSHVKESTHIDLSGLRGFPS